MTVNMTFSWLFKTGRQKSIPQISTLFLPFTTSTTSWILNSNARMRILFLSRRFPPVRLGYVTEVNWPRGTGNAVRGLGNILGYTRSQDDGLLREEDCCRSWKVVSWKLNALAQLGIKNLEKNSSWQRRGNRLAFPRVFRDLFCLRPLSAGKRLVGPPWCSVYSFGWWNTYRS